MIERLSSSYKNGRIGHAYMFDGERGTGKEAVALFFAKLLLCAILKILFHVKHVILVDVSHPVIILT